MVYSREKRVFVSEHYFAAVRESFSNAYPDKEGLVTTFRDTVSVGDRKHVQRRTVLTGETLRNGEDTLKITRLSCCIDVTKAYRYCWSYGCVLNGTPCVQCIYLRGGI
jgi:hypothetical protein